MVLVSKSIKAQAVFNQSIVTVQRKVWDQAFDGTNGRLYTYVQMPRRQQVLEETQEDRLTLIKFGEPTEEEWVGELPF